MNVAIDLSMVLRANYYTTQKFVEADKIDPDKFFEQIKTAINNLLFDIASTHMIRNIVLCLDSREIFRQQLSPLYKAHREPDFIFIALRDYVQPKLKDHFQCIEHPGLEADDLIHLYSIAGDTIIVSGDEDLQQNIKNGNLYFHSIRREFIDVLEPDWILFQKVVFGCPGDGVTRILKKGYFKTRLKLMYLDMNWQPDYATKDFNEMFQYYETEMNYEQFNFNLELVWHSARVYAKYVDITKLEL